MNKKAYDPIDNPVDPLYRVLKARSLGLEPYEADITAVIEELRTARLDIGLLKLAVENERRLRESCEKALQEAHDHILSMG